MITVVGIVLKLMLIAGIECLPGGLSGLLEGNLMLVAECFGVAKPGSAICHEKQRQFCSSTCTFE